MTCSMIDESLLRLTASGGMPEFSAVEMEHLRTCPRCARRAAEVAAAAESIAAVPPAGKPGPAYWASILPRVREKAGRRVRPGPFAALAAPVRALMPAAAAVVIVILVAVTGVEPPGPETGREIISTLSAAELYDLRQSGRYTGLLEPGEPGGGAENAVADLLSDLLSEKGEDALYAVAEPEELLREVDEPQFTEIVGILEHR